MPRPSIVIGVGGTGVSVLSWLKKDLLETHQGSLDGLPIGLLLLDVADIIAATGSAGVSDETHLQDADAADLRKRYASGDNDINRETEFVRLPTNTSPDIIKQIKQDIRRGESQHIGRWYRAGAFPIIAEENLRNGAGQFRQLGRLSLVQGVQLEGVNNTVYNKLQGMIERVASNRGELDVHIAGSFAGGTGSGIFLDIAWLVRKVAEDLFPNIQMLVTGFFAMPDALRQRPPVEMQAKSFAAWRELNRMQTIRENITEFEQIWGRGNDRCYSVRRPTYDHVYLIACGLDGQYHDPLQSVFPMMAEAISFFMDESSGKIYAQNISSNLPTIKVQVGYRDMPTYSTLYVKSWKMPSFHQRNLSRHQLALAFVSKLFEVELNAQSSDEFNERYRLSACYCEGRVTNILTDDMSNDDIGNTSFIKNIEEIRSFSPNEYDNQVEDYATSKDLLAEYIALPQSTASGRVMSQISAVTDFDIPDIIDSNNRDELDAFVDRVRNMLYGQTVGQGRYNDLFGDFIGEGVRGQLYEQLRYVHEFQVQTFQDRVANWSARTLNDPGNQGTGLACVASALAQLEHDVLSTITFYEQVIQSLPDVNAMIGQAKEAYEDARSRLERGGFFGGGHRRAVEAWLDTERDLLFVMKNRRTLQRMINSVREIYTFVRDRAIPSVERVTEKLISSNASLKIRSLYESLQQGISTEANRHAFDQSVDVTGVIEILETDDHTSNPNTVQFDNILDQFIASTSWVIDANMQLALTIRLETPDGDEEELTLDSTTRNADDAVQRFKNRLVMKLAESLTGGSELALNHIQMSEFKNQLAESAKPGKLLFRPATQGIPPKSRRTFYVRCQANENQRRELAGMVAALDLPRGDGHTATVVPSENANKIVVFSALELLLPEDFIEWGQVQEAYWDRLAVDRDHLQADHLFAGEQNAVWLEHRYYSDRRYRSAAQAREKLVFSNRIVHLLENKALLMNFLKLWTLGYIKDQVEGDPVWTVRIPGARDDWFALYTRLGTTMLDTLSRFTVFGYDYYGEEIPHATINERLNTDVIRGNWFQSADTSAELLQRYEYESVMARELGETLYEEVFRRKERSSDRIENAIYDTVARAHEKSPVYSLVPGREEEPQRSLAETIALDYADSIRTDEGEVVLYQMVRYVLRLLYDELYDEVVERRKDYRHR